MILLVEGETCSSMVEETSLEVVEMNSGMEVEVTSLDVVEICRRREEEETVMVVVVTCSNMEVVNAWV